MIRHDDSDAQVEVLSIVVPTAFEHDGTHALRKNPPLIGTECHEVLLVIALKMGKLSTVESLRHRSYVGTAAPGCPAERSSAVLKSSRKSEAACLADSFKLSFDSRLGNHGEGKNRRVSLAGQPRAAVPT